MDRERGMTITNDESLNRLQVAVDGGQGVLRYRIQGDTIWLLHVQVPEQAQGHGVASKLTQTALNLAKERGLKVVPVCSFIATYIRRHPEYAAFVR